MSPSLPCAGFKYNVRKVYFLETSFSFTRESNLYTETYFALTVFKSNQNIMCWILVSHSGDCEECNLCSSEAAWSFGGTYCLQLHGKIVSHARNQQEQAKILAVFLWTSCVVSQKIEYHTLLIAAFLHFKMVSTSNRMKILGSMSYKATGIWTISS